MLILMQTITFPEIGIEINLNRIAFSIGSIGIHWYAIFIVFALIIALLFLYKKRNKMEIKFETLVDLMLYLIPISLICARIYYCLFRGDYYFKNPWKIFYIQDGGLAIYGGIIGGALTCYLF